MMDLKKLEEGLHQSKQLLAIENANNSTSSEEKTPLSISTQKLLIFVSDADKQHQACKKLVGESLEEFQGVCRFLGITDAATKTTAGSENQSHPNSTNNSITGTPEDVFGRILQFSKSMHSASSYAIIKERRRLKILSTVT